MIRWTAVAGMLLFLAASTPAHSEETDSAGVAFFEKKIRPALIEHCYKCHSASSKELKGGLLVDTRAGLFKGGESGPAVVPGKAKASLLISAIKHDEFEMPPDKKLPEALIADFERWITMGAPDPRTGGSGPVARTIDIEAGRSFWSFQPVQDPQPPAVSDGAWPRADLDRFVLAELETRNLKPVADADRSSLVRRLYFDLIGLPPTAEQVQTFVADSSPQAVEKLVNQLLASPQFGERWGRHWLDVARYAESNGNVRNQTFGHAWRYRDYVIRALNADTPYDEFLTQQIAGDLLEAETVAERNEHLVATGFLALASKPVIRGKQTNGYIPDIADDQIEVTTRSIMALTVACARCHDHKFDPIPTTNYYAMAGIFASSETRYGGGGNAMGAFRDAGLVTLESDNPEEQKAYAAWEARLKELEKEQKDVAAQLKKAGRGKRARKNRKKKNSAAKGNELAREKQKRLDQLTARSREIAEQLKQHRKAAVPAPEQAMGMHDAAAVTEVPVHVRGVTAKGTPIARGFVEVAYSGKQINLPAGASGRLELARWLASAENPLTSRVAVNRIWLHLFGEGLVRTPDNFGKNGEAPSHPELLDYLAARFVADDAWSVKKMIRRIVLSRTYGLSTMHDPHNYDLDPDNVYVWRHARRRLEAEAIRDSILAASGQLDLEPPQGSVVAKHGGKLIQDALTPDKIHEPNNHRSLYLAMLRNGLPDVLEIFDVADPSLVVGRRNVTTVPAQELYLMNNPFVVAQAGHFAELLLQADAESDNDRIETAYWRALSRKPTDQEKQRAAQFLENASSSQAGESASIEQQKRFAWTALCQALFVSAEFRYVN